MTRTIEAGPTETTVRPGRWQLDPSQSRLEFRINHLWGLRRVTGRFDHIAGALTVAEDGSRSITLEVEAASLDTGNPQRDRHLRSDDFFDTTAHPLVRFDSTEIVDEGQNCLRLSGKLEAAGKAVELTFLADISNNRDELELHAATSVDPRRLGMTWSPLGMIHGQARLIADVRLRPRGPQPTPDGGDILGA